MKVCDFPVLHFEHLWAVLFELRHVIGCCHAEAISAKLSKAKVKAAHESSELHPNLIYNKQWFIAPINPIFTMGKSWTPIDCHCKNINSLILSCHTWNIPKKCPSRIYKQWKSDWYASWECFIFENSELSCWKFLQWESMGVHDFPIVKIGLIGAINHCFNNKSQTDPSPCLIWYFYQFYYKGTL